ncbi:hypothetical protein KKA08_09810, partial [bacterium]|nr:hypothetical protein [bacterium]
ELNTSNHSVEHVFPRWLQERFDLKDQRITLMNGSTIQYMKLTIPCCKKCNNDYLSPIEERVKIAVLSGYDATEQLDDLTLFIWLGKIFYGLICKEYFLPMDRKNKQEGCIADERIMEELRMHHLFLQSVRINFDFKLFFPASILVFPLKCPDNISGQFNFRDNILGFSISMQLGDVGIIAALQDCGTQKDGLSDLLNRFKDID